VSKIRIDEQFLLWRKFEEDLYYNNRYFNQHEILNYIKMIVSENEFVLKKGDSLYRARIHNGCASYIEGFKRVIKNYSKNYNADDELSDIDKLQERLDVCDLERRIDTGFWGYDKKGSFVPDNPNIVGDGRANPSRVVYLYAANEPIVAVAEVRPLIGDYVSVAKIETIADLRIADLTYNAISNVPDECKMLAYLIFEEFSKPNNGNRFDYIRTQYISEYMKILGFDGIKYSSSLYRRGENYAIFNYGKCEPSESKLYQLDDVCQELKCVGPVGDILRKNDLYHWKLEGYKNEKREEIRNRYGQANKGNT